VDLFGVEMPMMNPSAAGTVLGSALVLEAILARRQQKVPDREPDRSWGICGGFSDRVAVTVGIGHR
jgi:hypothetical protein